jgi:shikimate kinase
MIVTLIGHKGAGKTSVGRVLADRLACAFWDTDQAMIETQKDQHTIADVFQALGEKKFRALEANIVQNLPINAGVLATGGGTLLNKITADYLKNKSTLVYLQADDRLLSERNVIHQGKGIFLKSIPDKVAYQKRHEIYKQYADMMIGVSEKTVDTIVMDIIHQLPA